MQSLGQVAEVVFLLLMPVLLLRLGVKLTLAIGMLAWALRYVFFAFGDAGSLYWMLLVGILLHGVCYDFFFVAGQIYTNRFAGERFRSSAQGLITLATYGIGILIGSLLAGPIVDSFVTADGHNWGQIWIFPAAIWIFPAAIWIFPAAIAGVVLVLFFILFKDTGERKRPTLLEEEAAATLEPPGAPLPPTRPADRR